MASDAGRWWPQPQVPRVFVCAFEEESGLSVKEKPRGRPVLRIPF